MSSQVTVIANAAYHSGLAIGYAMITHLIFKSTATPKLDISKYDTGMAFIDIGLAIWARDMLVANGIIPADILQSTAQFVGAVVNELAFSGANFLFLMSTETYRKKNQMLKKHFRKI